MVNMHKKPTQTVTKAQTVDTGAEKQQHYPQCHTASNLSYCMTSLVGMGQAYRFE